MAVRKDQEFRKRIFLILLSVRFPVEETVLHPYFFRDSSYYILYREFEERRHPYGRAGYDFC